MSTQIDIHFSSCGAVEPLLARWRKSDQTRALESGELAFGDMDRATPLTRQLLREALNVDVDMSLEFKLDKDRIEAALPVMTEVFVAWVFSREGDFVVMKDFDRPIAYRAQGRLFVQGAGLPPIWASNWARVFGGTPHEVAEIPSI